jgi:signal transduction histidine kinase
MTKIRITFLVLAVVLLVPLGLVVRGALESVRRERELRHQAVAERIFDEMERELTAFLRREEERTVEEYAFLTSRRVDTVDLPFITGYFEIRPDGSIETWPESSRSLTVDLVRVLSRDDRSGQLVESFREEGAMEQQAVTQRPGTTVSLKDAKGTPASDDRKESGRDSLYSSESVLRQLNRGAVARKVRETPESMAAPANGSSTEEARSVDALSFDSIETDPADLSADRDHQRMQMKSGDGVPPMAARLIGEEYLLLWRDVIESRTSSRQGLVLRVPGLLDWLSARVIDSSELTGYARLLPASGSEAEGRYSNGYDTLLYRHQFDEPFTDLAGTLALSPLPESGGASYLYWLSALVVAASTLGLLALYRMVAVVVGFAERQQNFVSAVTHELKTPLTAIRLYGEMLRDELVPDEAKRRQYFAVITAESERLTRLVNNVLELGKLQRKKRVVNLVAGPLEPVVRDVVGVLEPHARNEGFEIQIRVSSDLPHALYDRDALQQVLFNLIDNAIKYTKNGSKRLIQVEAEQRDGEVSVAVVDHGPGVGDRNLQKVFEPFFRGESELTRTAKGTGIGLPLVRGLVESMGGTVIGENLADGGFKVRVSLRLATPTSA